MFHSIRILGPAAVVLSLAGCGPAEPQEAAEERSSAVSFTDITAEAGLGGFRHVNGAVGDVWLPETMGAGGGFVDIDGDGWEDVVVVGGGAWDAAADAQVRKLRIYRNNRDGSFSEDTTPSGLDDLPGYGFGIAAADYDNDGDRDLLLTTLGPNHLLRNDSGSGSGAGSGAFTRVTAEAGLDTAPSWSTAALFFDADRDGWVDLFVGRYVDWSPETDIYCSTDGEAKGYCTPELYEGLPGLFYRNRGDGTFEEVTAEAGFNTTGGKTLGVAELDFNRDGWPDLAVSNDTEPDLLYRNDGDGTFTEIGVLSGMAFDEQGRARAGMGIDAGVVDPSGETTLFVGNFSNEMIGVYRHLGNSAFLDRAAASRIGRTSLLRLTFAVLLFDVDLDGDLDLFGANGHVKPAIERVSDNVTFRQPPHLFLNRGDGSFADAAPDLGSPLTDSLVARAAAYADIDRDGDLDILLTENDGPMHLWRNDMPPSTGVLRVQLEGRESNRDGLGARVVVVAGGARQERRIRTGSSYLAQSELTATFGLAGASRVDSLLVDWPSGRVDRWGDLEAGRTVRIVEGEEPVVVN